MTPAAIAADLHAAIRSGLDLFQHIEEARTSHRPQEGGWCAREVLGHLIDSACNNHRRFVIGRGSPPLVFHGYNQDEWVERQCYAQVPFRDIVALWAAYNRHLAHVIANTPPDALANTGDGPDGDVVSLGFLMEDYVTHLRHHLEQLRSLLTA
jgi:DinB family protein